MELLDVSSARRPVSDLPVLGSPQLHPIPELRMAPRPHFNFLSLNLSCVWCSHTYKIKLNIFLLIYLTSAYFFGQLEG